MQIELERQIMDSVVLASVFEDRQYFRLYEIADRSGIRKENLHRVLTRLINREWVEKSIMYSSPGVEPVGKVIMLMSDSEDLTKTKKLIPKDIIDDFMSKEHRSYRQGRYLSPEEVEQGVPFWNRAKQWREAWKSAIQKEHTFYRVVQYPYLFRKHEARIYKNRTEPEHIEFPDWDKLIPEGTKRFWKKAAKELHFTVSSYNGPVLERLIRTANEKLNIKTLSNLK